MSYSAAATYVTKLGTIHVICDPPPIPVREFDWCAVLNDYEPGDPMGWGRTEADAIADLKEQLDEARDG